LKDEGPVQPIIDELRRKGVSQERLETEYIPMLKKSMVGKIIQI
jgi:hypothetical protein